jgi:3-oxoacyl-[acyl-carrier-protein] synthase-1/3-oxoacyl-[acyl-carrier-protein] synthase II
MVTPLGGTAHETWAALLTGRSGCGPLTRFPTASFPVRIAAEVPAAFRTPCRHGSLAFTFAERAAAEAIRHAGLPESGLGPDTALVVGVGGDDNGTDQALADLAALAEAHPGVPYEALAAVAGDRPSPAGEYLPLDGLAPALASRFGIGGEVLCVATACAAGAHAVALAADLLADGAARRVIVVGCDAMLSRVNLANFCALGVLSRRNGVPDEACRPFDTRRQGFVMGEGGGALVLEVDPDVRGPGRAVGRLSGYGVSADAYSITDKEPDGDGMLTAVRQAMATGGVSADDVAYVNAHGTGTAKNDTAEAAAIRRALGARAAVVPVSSIKGQIGHTIAAAGIIEAIVTLQAINLRVAPGTQTLGVISPDVADLRILGPGTHPIGPGVGLSISAGFGGVNVCLILAGGDRRDTRAA